jgi:hypothetical protein
MSRELGKVDLENAFGEPTVSMLLSDITMRDLLITTKTLAVA